MASEGESVETAAQPAALESDPHQAPEPSPEPAAEPSPELSPELSLKLAPDPAPDPAPQSAPQPAPRPARNTKSPSPATASDPPLPIKLTDAVGRKFTFPFDLVKTWRGVEELLNQAFLHVDIIGLHVRDGHYDIIGPDGSIILPSLWERMIQPGWAVTMHMWPMEMAPNRGPPPPLRAGQHGMPPPPRPRPGQHGMVRPPGMPPAGPSRPTPASRRPGMPPQPPPMWPGSGPSGGAPPPPPPGWPQGRPPGGVPPPPVNIVNVNPPKVKKKKPFMKSDPFASLLGPSKPTGKKFGRPARFGSFGGSDDELEVASAMGSSISSGLRSDEEASTRADAVEKGLVLVVRRQQAAIAPGVGILPARTFANRDENPSAADKKRIFSSARIYQDELETGLVSLELTSRAPADKEKPIGAGPGDMWWLEEIRDILVFEEFEHIALSRDDIFIDSRTRTAIRSLLRHIHERKLSRSRSGWFVKPGTVMRCDVEGGGSATATVTFLSVPYLYADSFSRSFKKLNTKGACVPRRLHEAFYPFDTSLERDKNQIFKQQEGSKSNEVLWIGETWILIVGSVGVFTYGGTMQPEALCDHIEMRDAPVENKDAERKVQVSMGKVQFQIPLMSCETFFDLQASIRAQTNLLFEYEEDDRHDVKPTYASGEVITAQNWRHIVEETTQKTILVMAEQSQLQWRETIFEGNYEPLVTEPSEPKPGREESDLSGDKDELLAASQDDVAKEKQAAKEAESPKGKSKMVEEDAFFSIERIAPTDVDTESDFDICELNPKVPPFLAWSILENSKHEGGHRRVKEDHRESMQVCMRRTESALREGQNPLVAKAKAAFSNLDFDTDEKIDLVHELLLEKLQTLGRRKSQDLPDEHWGKFSDSKTSLLYRDFASASVRAIEAYTYPDFPSPIVSGYYRALLEGLKAPKHQPALGEESPKCIITRDTRLNSRFRYRGAATDTARCSDCDRQVIYASSEKAFEHLRKKHGMASAIERKLRQNISSLGTAAETRLNQEFSDVLGTCRDTVASLVKRSRAIQDGLVTDNKFRQPAQGLPNALLQSLELIIAYVYAVSALLDDMLRFYRRDVFETDVDSLALSRNLKLKHLVLKQISSKLEALIKSSEKALISFSRKKGDIVQFFTSVGPHCVATQMVSNLLRNHVHNSASIAELYQAYAANMASQAKRRPSKRQLPAIGALADEISRLRTVTEWQRSLLSSLRDVLSPATHEYQTDGPKAKADGNTNPKEKSAADGAEPVATGDKNTKDETSSTNRARLRSTQFAVEEYIIERGAEELQDRMDLLKAELQRCESLVEAVGAWTEVMRDDNDRAILVFTVVTVIFLPLSFVASYLSMAGGPGTDGWNFIQARFWEVAAPLAVGIGAFCLGVAWSGDDLRDWIEDILYGRPTIKARRRRRRRALDSDDDYDDEDDEDDDDDDDDRSTDDGDSLRRKKWWRWPWRLRRRRRVVEDGETSSREGRESSSSGGSWLVDA